MNGPYVYTLPTYQDERGNLTVAEAAIDCPFSVQRVFWVYNGDGEQARGGHAHQECRQVLIALQGAVKVTLLDAECRHSDHVRLDDPAQALYIPPLTFVEYRLRPGAVLLVLCSHGFDPDDFIYPSGAE